MCIRDRFGKARQCWRQFGAMGGYTRQGHNSAVSTKANSGELVNSFEAAGSASLRKSMRIVMVVACSGRADLARLNLCRLILRGTCISARRHGFRMMGARARTVSILVN